MSDFIEELKHSHKDFEKDHLNAQDIDNPFVLFEEWYQMAFDKNCLEPNAMVLSTSGKKAPSSRIVYLKEMLDQELVFYTNYSSQKGQEIERNPNVGILFFWPQLEKQIRIEGHCSKVAPSVSDEYFASRPRGSQLGAWASDQSAVVEHRDVIMQKIEVLEKKYEGKPVPRPPHWGGYKIVPTFFEFWQGRPSRLHDRICFEKEDENWKKYRINP